MNTFLYIYFLIYLSPWLFGLIYKILRFFADDNTWYAMNIFKDQNSKIWGMFTLQKIF